MRQEHTSWGVVRSKGTDAAKAPNRATGSGAGSRPDPVCFSTQDSPHASAWDAAESLLSGRHSPSNRSAGQPVGVFGERQSEAGATLWSEVGRWRHRLGGGADQPPPVRSRTLQPSVSAGSGIGRIGARPSGRGEHAAMRAWPATAGGSGRTASAAATRNPAPVWQKARCSLACTPGTRRRMWTLWTKHGSRSLASLAVYRGGSGQAFGSATEQASAGSPVPADAASAGFASVGRRHEPSLEVCASARSDGAGDDNGKRATTAVMRHGYRRGECFEGYEPRCGERCRAARPVGARTFGFSKQTARGRHRETQRTLSGSGCKMSEPPERSKPSRW